MLDDTMMDAMSFDEPFLDDNVSFDMSIFGPTTYLWNTSGFKMKKLKTNCLNTFQKILLI